MTKQERCPIHKPGWYSECSTCNPDTQGQPEQSVSEKLWEFMEQFIGPTGGWLVSPKKLHAALVTYMQGKE